MDYPVLRLKPREDRRLRAGHLWVYSNEVDVAQTPLTAFAPGDLLAVQDARGRTLGMGYVNPHSLICVRLMSRNPHRELDRAFFEERLRLALALREGWFEEPFYRLVYGEGDGLPGLVVDRYGDVLVGQITTAGMEQRRELIAEVLQALLRPAALLWRNDSPAREFEGLPLESVEAFGSVPERVPLRENGVRFEADVRGGQKTGWYYDHRDNRARLARLARGRRVLDVFSYAGAWGVQAAAAGAEQVLCVDASAGALGEARRNAALNGVEARLGTVEGNVFEVLRGLRQDRERFDLVVLDPPAFIKRRKDMAEGEAAYRRVNRLAMQLLGRDGFLVSASCSHHLAEGRLLHLVHDTGRELGRAVQLLARGHQGADHPVHPAIPESEYLKALFVRIASP